MTSVTMETNRRGENRSPVAENPPMTPDVTMTDAIDATMATRNATAPTKSTLTILRNSRKDTASGKNPNASIANNSYETPKITDSTDDGTFTEVINRKTASLKTLLATKKYRCGLHFSRIAPAGEAMVNPSDLQFLFETIAAVDKGAIFLPFNNSLHNACGIMKIATGKHHDYTKLTDIQVLHWGRPDEGKEKLVFSFYIASDIIHPNLTELKKNHNLERFLELGKFSLTSHRLHESNTKFLGFFLGKNPDYTWFDDIETRFSQHINTHLSKNTKTSTLQWKDSDKQPPLEIDEFKCQAKRANIRHEGEDIPVVMISVGNKDFKSIEQGLENFKFQDAEFVHLSWKRSIKQTFIDRLDEHRTLSNGSRAVKIAATTETFRHAIRQNARGDPSISKLIIDVAERNQTATTGAIFIQCHEKDKLTITTWAQTEIDCYVQAFPNDPPPIIDTSTSSPTSVPMVAPSIFQHVRSDQSYATTRTRTVKQQKRIPTAVSIKAKSFADVLRSSLSPTTQNQSDKSTASSMSSLGSPTSSEPTRADTAKTQREIELESIVSRISKRMTSLEDENRFVKQQWKKEIKDRDEKLREKEEKLITMMEEHKTMMLRIQENHDREKEEHKTMMLRLQENHDREKAEIKAEWETRMEEKILQIVSRVTQTSEPPMSPARKRVDSKITPVKAPDPTNAMEIENIHPLDPPDISATILDTSGDLIEFFNPNDFPRLEPPPTPPTTHEKAPTKQKPNKQTGRGLKQGQRQESC
jgi:Skp family chaperone for outer membrane proteins